MFRRKRVESDYTDRDDGCSRQTQHHRRLPLIDDFGFDSSEKAILDIVRHLSRGMVSAAYDGLARALERANLEWNEAASARIVDSLAFLLARLQAVRTNAFEFIITDCSSCRRHICQSELQLMLMLRAGRRDDPFRLATAAQLVAVSGEPESLIVAAKIVAAALEGHGAYTHQASNTLH